MTTKCPVCILLHFHNHERLSDCLCKTLPKSLSVLSAWRTTGKPLGLAIRVIRATSFGLAIRESNSCPYGAEQLCGSCILPYRRLHWNMDRWTSEMLLILIDLGVTVKNTIPSSCNVLQGCVRISVHPFLFYILRLPLSSLAL